MALKFRKEVWKISEAAYKVSEAGSKVSEIVFKVSKMAFKVSKATFKVSKAAFKVSKAAFKVSEAAFKVSKAAFKVNICIYIYMHINTYINAPSYISKQQLQCQHSLPNSLWGYNWMALIHYYLLLIVSKVALILLSKVIN